MCGIAGILYLDGIRPVDRDVLQSMTRALAHRGPDDEGLFLGPGVGLGHRRLSIIDLEGGHQPLADESGDYQIIFNGEIYNYPSLKADLEGKGHHFKTRSDTETILRGYMEYGEDCVKHLNGMFAFAIWDARARRLFLARDRLGKKPLYYRVDGEKLLFASEMKSILRHPSVGRSIDPVALDAYFRHDYVPDPLTIFQGIRKLPPATTLACSAGTVSLRKYWSVDYGIQERRSEEDWAEELLALTNDAVKIRLMSEVPLGVFLSGGVDSSAITGLMARNSTHRVKTFSIKGGEGAFNELPFARAVAEHYGTEHHELEVVPESMESLLPKLIGHFDEPFADSSAVPTYYVSKLARDRVTVALSGEGGDELFAGYTWHKAFMALRRMRPFLVAGSGLGLGKILPDSSVPSVFSNPFQRVLYRLSLARRFALQTEAESFQSLRSAFHPHLGSLLYTDGFREELLRAGGGVATLRDRFASGGNARDSLDRALFTDINEYLPGDLLTKVDRMSMANSLEVRAPLLDYRIVELSARMPSDLKLRGATSKYILKYAMKDVLPEVIKRRKTKRGFSVPLEAWFRGSLGEFAREALLGDDAFSRAFLRKDGLEKMLAGQVSGRRNYGTQIWALLVFELWGRQYCRA
jgi:asparagine synthase (glutamine-hydrolysing)